MICSSINLPIAIKLGKKMKRFKKSLAALCIASLFVNVQADDLADLKAQMITMQQQMQLMQQKLVVQQQKLDQQAQMTVKSQVSENASGVKAIAHEIADSLNMSGEVVINTARTDSDAWVGESSSDIVLDTLALSIDAQVTSWVSSHIGLLI